MKYGKNKESILQKQHIQIFKLDKDGIGSEIKKTVIVPTEVLKEQTSFVEEEQRKELQDDKQKILNFLRNPEIRAVQKKELIDPTKSIWIRFKLYLNRKKKIFNDTIIGFKAHIFKWWHTDTTDDMKDLGTFVLLHGIMGLSILLIIFQIMGLTTSVTDYMRNSLVTTILIYIIGTGSMYYFFIDINKELYQTWKKK